MPQYDKNIDRWLAYGQCVRHGVVSADKSTTESPTPVDIIYEAHSVCLASGARIPRQLQVVFDFECK